MSLGTLYFSAMENQFPLTWEFFQEASKLNETKWLLFVIEESSSQLLIEHLKPWTNAFTSHLRGQEAAENLKISCWHGLRLLYARY